MQKKLEEHLKEIYILLNALSINAKKEFIPVKHNESFIMCSIEELLTFSVAVLFKKSPEIKSIIIRSILTIRDDLLLYYTLIGKIDRLQLKILVRSIFERLAILIGNCLIEDLDDLISFRHKKVLEQKERQV